MIRRSKLASCVGLMGTLLFGPAIGMADDDVWIGREFVPKSTCRPKIGTQDVQLTRLPVPFKVQQVQGEWLWVGQAWVKKRDVAPVVELIEEFSVDRWNNFFIKLPVTIKGRPYHFAFDTGCVYCIVDSKFRSEFPASGDQHDLAVEGAQPFRQLEETHLGTSRIPVSCDAICLDLSEFRWPGGYGIHGVLGMNFLKHHVVQLDLDSGKLSFMKSPPRFAQWQLTTKYESERPVWEIKMGDRGNVPFILDTGMIGRTAVQFETGIFQELMDRERINRVYDGKSLTFLGVERKRYGKIDTFGVDGWEVKSAHVGEGTNMLGVEFLKGRVILFDFPNRSISMRKKAAN